MRIALALVLVLLAPSALAHVDAYTQSRALNAGPFTVFFEPRPTPPFSNQTASMVASIADSGTGTLLPRARASILVAGPQEFSFRKAFEPDGTGYQVATVVLPHAGNYSARILIRDDANETHSADTEFEVFPDIPYRIRPVDQVADLYVGQRATLAFEVVDPVTLAPKPVADLKVRIEHWSEDHKEFLGSQEEPVEPGGTGVWRIRPIVQERGMYHIRFASEAGGFNYADVPLLHVYATSPPVEDEAETPLGGTLLALLGLAVVAIALRRR